MPLSKYNRYFGGKKGAAEKAYSNMLKEYGPEKGKRVFYATKNKHASKNQSRDRMISNFQKRHGR